jgi:hypothetical protein
MERTKRTVEAAAEIYLDRLTRALAFGDKLADAKNRALTVAVAWLDDRVDTAKWQPLIEAVLAKRLPRGDWFLPSVET